MKIYSTNYRSFPSLQQSSFYIDKVRRIIIDYSLLPSNWDFGLGDTPSKSVIDKSLEIYKKIQSHGFSTEPHPLTEGGILLVAFKKPFDHFLNVFINSDLSIDFRHEKGIGIEYDVIAESENVSIKTIEQKLIEIKLKWITSGFSISSTNTIGQLRDLYGHSNNTTGESQYLKEIVQNLPMVAYASTLPNSILKQREPQFSTGLLKTVI